MNPIIFIRHVVFFWRIPNRVIDRINPYCLPVSVATPALVGSVVSFWIIGMMGLCLTRTISGAMAVTRRKEARIIGALFCAWCVLHIVFGLAHSQSSDTLLEIVEVLPFLGFLPLYAGLALTPPNKLVRISEDTIIAGAIGSSVIAGYQIFDGMGRAEGAAGNPGPFGLIGLVLYGYCLIAMLRASGNRQLITGIGVACAFGCVLLSGMRGLWPGLIILPVVVGLIYRSQLDLRNQYRRIVMVLGLMALVAFASFSLIESRIALLLTEFNSISGELDFSRSLDQHVALWTAGIELFSQAPFSGHGLQTAPLMATETLELFGEPFARSHFHNALIDIGVKSGIFGIVILVAMLIWPPILTAKYRRSDAGRFGFAMMSVLMTSYAISGVSGIMLGHDILDTVFIFSTAYWAMFAFEGQRDDE